MRRWGRSKSPGRFGSRLLKDTHNLGLKFRKIEREHRAARMEDKIATLREQRNVSPQGLAHATLDAIALMGLAHNFAGCESHTRGWDDPVGLLFPWGKEPAHGGRLTLAACRVGALIISVLLQAQASQRLALNCGGASPPAGLVGGGVQLVHHGNAGR